MSSSQKSLSRKKQPVAVEQDSRVSAYTPEKTNIESYLADNPTLTSSQFRQVVDYAFKLQEAHDNFEARQIAVSDLEKRAVEESKREDNEINIAAISRVASDLGLRGEYLERALRFYAPSREQIKADVKKFGSIYANKFVAIELAKKARDYIQAISEELSRQIPYAKVICKKHISNFTFSIFLEEEKVKEVRPWYIIGKKRKKKVKEKTKIAKINVCQPYTPTKRADITFYVHHPIFFQTCGDLIENANYFFSDFNISSMLFHNYPEE